MSFRQSLLGSCANVMIVSLRNGFRAAVWFGDIGPQLKFVSSWDRLAEGNPVFRTAYNMKAMQ